MVEIDINPKEIIKELKSKPRDLKNLVLQKSPDRKLLIYFSLGHLADMYMQHAEEMMKKNKSLEANYFSGKSMQIKGISRKTFGQAPEEDIYTRKFKVPRHWSTKTDKEEIDQLAQFCVQNIPEVPGAGNPNEIKGIIKEKLSTYTKTGTNRKFIRELRKTTEETMNPTKLNTVLELTLLLENVNEVLKAIKEEDNEDEDEETEKKDELEGIKKKGVSVEDIK
ncbi:MAG: hypothetical protein ACOCTT_03205 [archaeon]